MNKSSLDHAKKYPQDTPWVQLITNSIELSFLSTPEWALKFDEIEQRLSKGALILDCSTDPFNGHEKTVKQQLLPITDNFCILSGDLNYLKNPDTHIIYYPTFYIEIIEQAAHPISIVKNPIRQWKVSCLNGRSRIHRVENFVKLKRKSAFQDILFSMHQEFDLDHELRESQSNFCDNSILKDFSSIQQSLSIRTDNNDLTSAHPAYTNSYVNLVTETSISNNQVFLTEKSFKPFTSGQFALWVASPGTVTHLRNLGFDVFDDIIDHSYDLVDDWHKRIDLVHSQVDRLITLDLEKIFNQTEERRIHNQEFLYSDTLHNKMLQQANRGVK